jgi:hypothetical protein
MLWLGDDGFDISSTKPEQHIDIDTHLIYPRKARGFAWTGSTPGLPLKHCVALLVIVLFDKACQS